MSLPVAYPALVSFPSDKDFKVGESYRVKVEGVAGLYTILEKTAVDDPESPWLYKAKREAPVWKN